MSDNNRSAPFELPMGLRWAGAALTVLGAVAAVLAICQFLSLDRRTTILLLGVIGWTLTVPLLVWVHQLRKQIEYLQDAADATREQAAEWSGQAKVVSESLRTVTSLWFAQQGTAATPRAQPEGDPG